MTYAQGQQQPQRSSSSPAQIEKRRRLVASMLARSMTESEIAQQLNVDQTTVSRDKKAIKEESQQFVFNLAKSDLSFYFKQRLDSLEQAKRKAWDICENTSDETINTDKVKLLSLKLIIAADEAAIKLLSEGPLMLTMQSMEDRLSQVEAVENVE